jgi:O-antigen/teichoic acid export membrane protein
LASNSSKLRINIAANIVGKLWSVLSNFLFVPLYIHFLGFSSYSIISLTLIIAGFMLILDGGITSTLSREFSRSDRDSSFKLKTFRNLELLYLIIISVIVTALVLSSPYLSKNWMNVDTFKSNQLSFFLNVIAVEMGLQMILRFYIGGFLGLEKQSIANIYQVLWGVFRNAFVIIILLIEPSLTIFFLWQCFSTFIFVILAKLKLEKILNSRYTLAIGLSFDKFVFSDTWKFGSGMLAIAAVSALNTQMDKILITKFFPINQLGFYTLAVTLTQGILVLVSPIAIALLPRLTAIYSAKKHQEGQALFKKFNLLISILVFSIFANLVFYPGKALWIWTGKSDLALQSEIYVPVLAFAYCMLGLQVMAYNVVVANGVTKINNIMGMISLIFTIPGYWIAIIKFGAIGAAFVFCFVQTFATFFYLFFVNKRFIGLHLLNDIYVKQMLLPLALAIGIAYGLFILVDFPLESRSMSLLLLSVKICITLIGSWLCFNFKNIKSIYETTIKYYNTYKK